MVPAGAPTESTVAALGRLLSPGDTIIDGGNTNFHDDVRRAETLAAKRIHYVDAGTSGGIWGLQEGYCLMVGGEADVCTRLEPIFPDARARERLSARRRSRRRPLREDDPQRHRVRPDAGVRRRLRADARQRLQDRPRRAVASLWMHGSVVRSWLLELTARALAEDPELSSLEAYVEDSGEGRWTLHEGIDRAVPLPVADGGALHALPLARATTRSASGCSPRCATSSAATP